MKCFFTTSIILLCTLAAAAQLKPFDVLLLSPRLKQNARTIKREEKIELDVKAPDKAYYKIHKAITVFNDAAEEELNFFVYTDQFSSLNDASVAVYDAQGNKLHKYGKNDLSKQAVGDGLVPDGKLYYLSLTAASYPATIVTDYEIKYNGLLMCDGI